MKKAFILGLLCSLPSIIFGQIDFRNWKSIDTVQNLELINLHRIKSLAPEILNSHWDDDETAGKCVITVQGWDINQKINSKDYYNVEDSLTTPFMVYLQNGLNERPEIGNFKIDYKDPQTNKPLNFDWKTFMITAGYPPFAFQIFTNDGSFQSRMIPMMVETNGNVSPLIEELKLTIEANTSKYILISKYEVSAIKQLFPGEKISSDIITIQIEIELHNNN